MKRTLATTLVILALAAGLIGAASTATAVPSKRTACTRCHRASARVVIGLTRTSATTTTATYRIRITGGSGQAGWALFRGTVNLKRRTASTGVITVVKGKAYRVWAVKKGTGARYRTLLAR